MISARRPRIAITCAGDGRLPRGSENYLASVSGAGGSAVFVAPSGDPKLLAEQYDGLIIPGGKDIHPSLYGEVPRFDMDMEEGRRTKFELSLLDGIIGGSKPALGICYGMQVINVYFHGTLYQDVGRQVKGALDHGKGLHLIKVAGCPFFSEGSMVVNTSHHQAVHTAGEGLRPFAVSEDGIVEAFYGESCRYLVGVQWHPERHEEGISLDIFRTFVEACGGR